MPKQVVIYFICSALNTVVWFLTLKCCFKKYIFDITLLFNLCPCFQKGCHKNQVENYCFIGLRTLAAVLTTAFKVFLKPLFCTEESHVKWGARSLCSTFVVHHWCNSRFMVTKWPLPWFYGGWSDKKGIFLVWETSRFANWPVKSRYGRFATPETR